MKKFITLALVFIMCVFAISCADADGGKMLYEEDTVLGDGNTTIIFTVEHFDGKMVTFTIKTDKTVLSDALLEHELIEGENDIYGLYVKKVNGITQDFNKDRTYWALYVDGAYSMEGVSSVKIKEGQTYTYRVSR